MHRYTNHMTETDTLEPKTLTGKLKPNIMTDTSIRYREATTKYSRAEIACLASHVLRAYICFKSAYIVGAYARGFPLPSDIISIVAFTHQGEPVDFERVHTHLEMTIGKPVEFLVSPPEDVVKGIKRWHLIRLE